MVIFPIEKLTVLVAHHIFPIKIGKKTFLMDISNLEEAERDEIRNKYWNALWPETEDEARYLTLYQAYLYKTYEHDENVDFELVDNDNDTYNLDQGGKGLVW